MANSSFSFQRNIICTILRIFICFALLRSCCTENSFSDLDLSSKTLNPTSTGFMITGSAAGDYFGYSVSTGGDVDNDGYDDIIVGAYGKSTKQGAAYVIYGGKKSSFLNLDLSAHTLNPTSTGFMITGGAVGDQFGYSVSTAGDINNDGYDDIIVGANMKNSYQGAAYVLYGGPKSTMSHIDLSSTPLNPLTTGFMITGYAANDQFGSSVSTAGDINNDGYDDIIVGAYGKSSFKGAAYVIYGGPKSTMSNWDFSSGATLNPSMTGFMITGKANNDQSGFSVSTVGDINNDGYDDIIVGAPNKDSSNYQGAAYVIYGGPKSSMSNWDFSSGATLDPLATGFMVTGSVNFDKVGWSVSTAGDINNDGYNDIIVGGPVKSGNPGAAYVIYGGEKSPTSNIALSSTTLDPPTTGFMITGSSLMQAGWSVSTAGDINNDGYDDIIFGANRRNNYQGAAYVVYGGPKSTMSNWDFGSGATFDPASTGFMITGNAAGDYFGSSVSTAGDINKDEYDDIIVGAYAKNSNQGAVYVIYGAQTNGCPAHCKQCSSESVCTECQNPYLLYQSECLDSCPDATLATSTTCESCPDNCNQCSSTSVCTECKNSYILHQSECLDSCPDGKFLSAMKTCEDCPNNCNQCSGASVCTECKNPYLLYQSECLDSCPSATFNLNNTCKDCPAYCSSCTSQKACQVCNQGFTLSNSLCVFSSQGAQQKATQALSSTATGISSVVCIGSTVAPLAALVSKTVQNTRYLNLSVTSDLSEIYQTWNTDLIPWDVPNIFANEDHFKTAPSLFAQFNTGSPFLVNFWPTLMNIIIGLTTFITCFVLQKLCDRAKYEGWASSLVQKLIAGSFNFALIQTYACLDDILFSLVLDIKTNPFNSFFSWASLIWAGIFLVLGCSLVFFNFWTVKKYQSIKKQGKKDEIDAFNEKNKYWELFYSDFNDDDLWSQSFFAILIVRSTLSSFIITVFYDYALMQTSYLVMLDGVIILFLYFKTPFNALRGKLAQYYYETVTLLVHICTFILSLQDTFPKPSDTVRLIFSTGIIYLNTALIGGSLGFMFIEIYKTISEKTRASKRKQAQSKPEDNQETQNLTQTARPLKLPETDDRTKQYWINREQTASIENFYFFPGVNQNGNVTTYDLNMESSRVREANFNADDNSRDLDMYPGHRLNQQRNQSIRPMLIRQQLQTLNKRKQRNNSIFPSHSINNEQFSYN